MNHYITGDILCGRGRGIANSLGNQRFRTTISQKLPCYLRASRAEKSLIINATIDAIQQDGLRFLKKKKNDEKWVELDKKQAREKVAHAFRDMVSSPASSEYKLLAKGKGKKRSLVNSNFDKKTVSQENETNSKDILEDETPPEPISLNSWRSTELVSLFCHQQGNKTGDRDLRKTAECHKMEECQRRVNQQPNFLDIFTSLCFTKDETETNTKVREMEDSSSYYVETDELLVPLSVGSRPSREIFHF